jgi:hypothetical protein
MSTAGDLAGQQSREDRLLEIRSQAERKGHVDAPGARPANAPFPVASPQDGYYRQPLLHQPQWSWAIPLYFFLGGAAGSLGVVGSLADLLDGRNEPTRTLARDARSLATGGVLVSSVLLVYDLGRPARFLHMLRVFKPSSVMSVGSWVLSCFGASASVCTLADLLDWRFGPTPVATFIRALGRTGSALFGLPFHNYTGVLIGATAIPAWNGRIASLPKHFGMSGLQSGVSILELAGHDDSPALNLLGLLSAGLEMQEALGDERAAGARFDPLRRGLSGTLLRLGAILSGPVPVALRLAACFLGGDARRSARRAAAWSGIAGSLCVRYGWLRAGTVSSRDYRTALSIPEPSESESPNYSDRFGHRKPKV